MLFKAPTGPRDTHLISAHSMVNILYFVMKSSSQSPSDIAEAILASVWFPLSPEFRTWTLIIAHLEFS